MTRKSDTLNLRVTPGFKELVRMAAEHDNRSISNLIEVLVQEYCHRTGIKAPAAKPMSIGPRGKVGS